MFVFITHMHSRSKPGNLTISLYSLSRVSTVICASSGGGAWLKNGSYGALRRFSSSGVLLLSPVKSADEEGGKTVGGVGGGRDELEELVFDDDDREVDTVEIEAAVDSRPKWRPSLSAASNKAKRLFEVAEGEEARRCSVWGSNIGEKSD